MTSQRDPIRDRNVEERLRASWDQALDRAERDLGNRGAELAILAATTRRRGGQGVRALAAAVTVVLIVAAFVVGWNGRQAFQGAAASSAPVGSAIPGDQSVPVLGPSQTLPPTVDGQPVVAVGPDADARIAAATDDSPIFVTGWLLGSDHGGCDHDPGTPAPNTISWDDCVAQPLRAASDGGASLLLFWVRGSPQYLLRPDSPLVQQVLIQVHAHDSRCVAADCIHKAVFDRALVYGATDLPQRILAATMPSGGIPVEQAVSMALDQIRAMIHRPEAYQPMVPIRVEAGTYAVVDDSNGVLQTRWVWKVSFVPADNGVEYIAIIDYLDGTPYMATSGPISVR